MKKMLLVSAFALLGTFALANEKEFTSTVFESKTEISIVDVLRCCYSKVYYNGEVVQEYTEC